MNPSEQVPFIPPRAEEQPIPPAPWKVFGTRPFFRLWLAQIFSSLGDWVGFFAILGITASVSHNSAAAVSLVMATRMLPSFFLATLGGVIVDRFDRRKVMVACDIGRAGLIIVLPFADSLLVLVLVSFAIEILTLLWGPAKDASVPHFLSKDQLASANSLSLVASYGTFPVGALIFSVLAVVATWLGGFKAFSGLKVDREVIALWVDAATYLTSALIVFRLPIPRGHRHGARIDWTQSVREIREGLQFIHGERLVRAVIVGLGGGIIGAGAMVPLGIVFAREILGSSAQWGVLMIALGTGAAVGLFSLLIFQQRVPRDTVFSYAVTGVGAFLVAAATFNVGGLAALMIVCVGACAGTAYVTGFTILQETVSDELRGRTFATLYTVVRLCLLISLTVSPLFADLYHWLFGLIVSDRRVTLGGFSYTFAGVRFALWGGGLLTIASGLYTRREIRRLRAQESSTKHPSGSARDDAAGEGSEGSPPPEPDEPPAAAEGAGGAGR